MEARQDIIQATEQEYVKLRAAIDGLGGEAQMSEVWLGDDVLREADRSQVGAAHYREHAAQILDWRGRCSGAEGRAR